MTLLILYLNALLILAAHLYGEGRPVMSWLDCAWLLAAEVVGMTALGLLLWELVPE